MKNSTGGTIDNHSQDEYQQRYLAHQQFGKKQELIALMKERHSNRRYDDKEVPQDIIDEIVEMTKHCPSSCDRHGVRIRIVTDRDEKAILNGLLVGGVGWIYRAPVVFLLLADPNAYKAGDEINYMPYLDAGVMIQQINLVAQASGLHSAYANPNIRENNQHHFKTLFKPTEWEDAMCMGAVAVGYPHPDEIRKRRDIEFDMTLR